MQDTGAQTTIIGAIHYDRSISETVGHGPDNFPALEMALKQRTTRLAGGIQGSTSPHLPTSFELEPVARRSRLRKLNQLMPFQFVHIFITVKSVCLCYFVNAEISATYRRRPLHETATTARSGIAGAYH
jgi:hypothetical protein